MSLFNILHWSACAISLPIGFLTGHQVLALGFQLTFQVGVLLGQVATYRQIGARR